MKLNNTTKAFMDGLLTLPLVLPPTVAGFFLLLIFSLRRPFGKYLYTQFDIKMVQTWPGCVIAAFVIAFPLMYRNARAAFEQVDVNVIYAGRTHVLWEWKESSYKEGFPDTILPEPRFPDPAFVQLRNIFLHDAS